MRRAISARNHKWFDWITKKYKITYDTVSHSVDADPQGPREYRSSAETKLFETDPGARNEKKLMDKRLAVEN